eukprot:Gregarina_sp_Poly_1__205@NODE_1048_length_5238_cov_33_236125_g728_i0_p1_GENE_NODE_1048_length_5238_cov_33_236125_g728_i0NODE_1048_length_5238_cov_33_236125_g728_i0_p1_ORF_typecomplete_len1004_score171_66Kelch_3/PF13415_6/9_8Kelch_3/PF13415_6/4_1e05Kelch_3/PF13415_6/7_4e09Kelch_3/PF13415_6/5_4e06Kelch_3/PF13415_6/0_00027Kelch_3/PF13415_6/0_007Kelch_4/PF13418_6/4e07Kelch_4/PF13418_6/4_3e06Kelch_4/PF13418_6/5e09Kelch_4/PF13418_6/0_00013Kelch_4/PF13418_6/0_017Kelch_6/PF13964_6/8e06Kelch_6/PF13964_6/
MNENKPDGSYRHSRSFDQEKRSNSSSLDRSKFEKLPSRGEAPPARTQHALASIDGIVLIFGGEAPIRDIKQDVQLLNDMYQYDMHQGVWTQIKAASAFEPWPEKRKGHTLIVSKASRSIVMFGGMGSIGQASGRKSARNRPVARKTSQGFENDDDNATGGDLIYYNDVWSFCLDKMQWKEVKTEGGRPTARAFHSAIYNGENQMIIYGGFGCHEDNDVWIFDLAQHRWSKVKVMEQSCRPARRWKHVSAFWSGSFYIFGGQVKSKLCDTAVWKLNMHSGFWSRIDPQNSGSHTPPSRCDFASAQMDSRWFIHGGNLGLTTTTQKTTNLMHEFNFRSEKWRQLTAMLHSPPQLEAHKACIVFEGPYVATIVLINGTNLSGSPVSWPQGGWRVDFLSPTATHGLPPKTEDMYLHPFVRDIILRLWREVCIKEDVSAELLTLKRERTNMLKENEALIARNQSLQHKQDEMKDSWLASRERADNLAAELADCKAARDRLSLQTQELHHLIERLEQQADIRENDLNQTQQMLEEAEKAHNKVRSELEWCRDLNDKRIEEFERDIETMKERENDVMLNCEALERELQLKNRLLSETENKLSDAETSNVSLKEENRSGLIDLEMVREKFKAASTELATLQITHQDYVQATNETLAQRKRELSDLERIIESKTAEYNSQSRRIEQMEQEMTNLRQEANNRIQGQREKLAKLSAEIEDANCIITTKERQLSESQTSVDNLNERLGEVIMELDLSRAQTTRANNQIDKLSRELQEAQEHIAQQKTQLTSLADGKEHMKSKISKLQETISRKEDLLLESRNALQQESERYSAIKEELQHQTNESKENQQRIEQLEEQKKSSENSVAELSKLNHQLETKLSLKDTELETVKRDLLEISEACQDLKNQLGQITTQLGRTINEHKEEASRLKLMLNDQIEANRQLEDNLASARLSAKACHAKLELAQTEMHQHQGLLKEIHKFLQTGHSFQGRIHEMLQGEMPLSPASTADDSDYSP